MCKNFLAVLLLFSCLFGACAQSKKSAGSGAPSKTSTSKSAKSGLRGLSSVTMRRGACFGRCPEYRITIHSNGLAEYTSVRNALPEGDFEKNIGADKAKMFLQQFMDQQADTCKDLYESRIADLPGLDYILMINGQKKTIYNAHFGPGYLVRLSTEMDELGKVDSTWKKVSKPKEED